jgi:aldehyde:ferredoxin oxidoreductase
MGTASSVLPNDAMGNLPTYNFREGSFDRAEKISGERLRDSLLVDRETCYACPIRCKRIVQAEEPYPLETQYGGPEYETIGAFGSLCGVDDLPAIARANQLCNAYTIDTISTGVSIAFGMECFEQGLINEKDTGGLALKFGNAKAMVEMVTRIARREGIGDLLALGVERAAKAIGGDAEQYAMHVKGLEIPMHNPRLKQGLGMGYAVASIGADHMQGLHDTSYINAGPTEVGLLDPLPPYDLSPAKVRMFSYLQRQWSSWNCLLMCDHCGEMYDPARLNDLVRGVTGWNTTVWELMKAGERSLTLARTFNMREGLSTADDWLPERFFAPQPSTPPPGIAVDRQDLRQAVDLYYEMMGWDAKGVPTRAKLIELGIDWVIDQLHRAG